MFESIHLSDKPSIDLPVLLTAMRSCESSRLAFEQNDREEREAMKKDIATLKTGMAVLTSRVATAGMIGAVIGGAVIQIISKILVP